MNIFSQLLNLFSSPDFWQSTLVLGAGVLLLPTLGGVISERSGVVNVAMEGLMLTGAFVAVVFALAWHNPWAATLMAIIAGGLVAAIHAVVSIRFRGDQIISGFAINIFALGGVLFVSDKLYGIGVGPGRIDSAWALPQINVPLLKDIPFIGQVFFQQNVVVYFAILMLVVVQLVLFRTRLGLRIRAVGEHPQAADTAGINVYALRYGAVIASGGLSAIAGAFYALTYTGGFSITGDMIGGKGYIALAAMIFGKWTPLGGFIACLIFGAGEVIAGANSTVTSISSHLLDMAPYILTLIVLAGLVGRSTAPAADGVPYTPGSE